MAYQKYVYSKKDLGLRSKRKRSKKMTYLYFIMNVDTNHVKIGYTSNIPDRLSALQTANSAKLRLYASIPVEPNDARDWESLLHDAVSEYALRGEWFSVPLVVLDDIINVYRRLIKKL